MVDKLYEKDKTHRFEILSSSNKKITDYYLENILELAFLSGVKKVDVINTSSEDFSKNLNQLLENEEIDYVCCENISSKNIIELSRILEEKSSVAGVVSISSVVDKKEIDCKNIVATFSEIGFNNSKEGFYSAIIVGSILGSSQNIKEDFRYMKIKPPITLYETRQEKSYFTMFLMGKEPYIEEILTISETPIDVIIRKKFVEKFLKSNLEKIFKTRQATKEKLRAIESQTIIILEDFKDKKVIKSYFIEEVKYLKETQICSLKVELIMDEIKKDLSFFIKLLI